MRNVELVRRDLEIAFIEDMEQTHGGGYSIPPAHVTIGIANGDIHKLVACDIPWALYTTMVYFCKLSYSESDRHSLVNFIRYLDVDEMGTMLNFVETTLGLNRLESDALKSPALLERAKLTDRDWARLLDDPAGDAVKTGKHDQLDLISSKQSRAILGWLQYIEERNEYCPEAPNLIKGAMAYWANRAGTRCH